MSSTTTQEEMQPNQIVPATTAQWLDNVKLAIDKVADTGKPGYKYNATHRCVGKVVCMPLCCSPCFVWSTVWRIICCPVSCFQGYGPLSNNGCTDLTDKCVATFYNQMDGKNTLDVQNIADSDLVEAINYAVYKIKSTTNTRTRYVIADFMFPAYKKFREGKGVIFIGTSCTPMDLETMHFH